MLHQPVCQKYVIIYYFIALSNNPLSHHISSCLIFFRHLMYLSLLHMIHLHWFFCYNIHHSLNRFCLICVFVRSVTEQSSFSQQNSSVFLLSCPHPLFILSSHLISSPLILLFSQEAPGLTSMSRSKKEGDSEVAREREKKEEREEDGDIEETYRERDSERERAKRG